MAPWLSAASPREDPRSIDLGRERGASIRHRFCSELCCPSASQPPRDTCDPAAGRGGYSVLDRTWICAIFGAWPYNAGLGVSPGATREGYYGALPGIGPLPGHGRGAE